MAIKNASASPAVQELIAWYEREIEVADHDPISQWPWAFGRFSDGTPIAARRIAASIATIATCRRAFPEPYDAGTGRLSFLGWCKTEGRLRYPELFAEGGTGRTPKPARIGTRVSVPMALRLFGLMLAPQGRQGAARATAAGVPARRALPGSRRRLHGPR